MLDASGGLADIRTIRRGHASNVHFAPHDGELVFGFVLDGTARLERVATFQIGPGDAFTIPPGDEWELSEMSRDFRLLHVTTARLDGGT
jgi:mannose-6-phosphate isomerase-like protein (cupin superfamily)